MDHSDLIDSIVGSDPGQEIELEGEGMDAVPAKDIDAEPVETPIAEVEANEPEVVEGFAEGEVEPDETPAEEVHSPTMVPVGAVQEERQKRQELQRDYDELQARMKLTEQPATEEPVEGEKPQAKVLDPKDPDPNTIVTQDDIDMMPQSEFHQFQIDCRKWEQREQHRKIEVHNQHQADIENQKWVNVEADARTRFDVEKMGESFDYDTVVNAGKAFLSQKDVQQVLSSDDPAKSLYDRCKERNPFIKDAPGQAALTQPKDPVIKKVVSDADAPTLDEALTGKNAELIESLVT